MKGSMEGILPMLALFLMSAAMATQALPISEALAQIVGSSTSDVERVVNTRSYADFYFYNYLPQTSEYSINNISYELGKDAGGLNTWNNSWIDGSPYFELYRHLEIESEDKLNSKITGSEGRCDVPDSNYSLSLFADYNTEDKRFTVVSSGSSSPEESPLQANCSDGASSRFISEDDVFNARKLAHNNRYTGLAKETTDNLARISKSLDTLGSTTYTGTGSSCGSSSNAEKKAEKEARTKLESAVKAKISDGVSIERDYVDLLKKPQNNFGVSDANWSHLESGKVKRSGTTTSSTDGNCGCCCSGPECDCEGSCKTSYDGTATASPAKVNMDWEIKDSEYEIIVDNTYEALKFFVSGSNSYTHNW